MMRLLISPALAVIAITSCIYACTEPGRFSGTVSSEEGTPMRGATIRVLGTTPSRGAISKEDGSFLIENLRPGVYDLEISSVGYSRITVKGVVTQDHGGNAIHVTMKTVFMKVTRCYVIEGEDTDESIPDTRERTRNNIPELE